MVPETWSCPELEGPFLCGTVPLLPAKSHNGTIHSQNKIKRHKNSNILYKYIYIYETAHKTHDWVPWCHTVLLPLTHLTVITPCVTLCKCITVTYTSYRHHSQCHTVLLPLTHLTVFTTSVILILYYHHLH